MFCCFGRFFLEKNAVFCLFLVALVHFSSRKSSFFPLVGCLPCLLPIKTRRFLPFVAILPIYFCLRICFLLMLQEAPKRLLETSQKAPRKHPEKFPEGPQKASRTLPEGSQKAPRRLPEGSQTLQQSSQKVPKSFPDDSTRLPEWLPKGSKNLPQAPRRSQKAPRKVPKKVQEAPGDINFAAFLHAASPGLLLQ